MRFWDARCTRLGTGITGTEAGTEVGDKHKYGGCRMAASWVLTQLALTT